MSTASLQNFCTSKGCRASELGKIAGQPTAGWILCSSTGKLIEGCAARLPFITITDNHGQPMEGHPRPVDTPVSLPLGDPSGTAQ
ncbi:MAG: hypothetical protein ABI389_05225 [Rhodanobacter sp.]